MAATQPARLASSDLGLRLLERRSQPLLILRRPRVGETIRRFDAPHPLADLVIESHRSGSLGFIPPEERQLAQVVAFHPLVGQIGATCIAPNLARAPGNRVIAG
jgi:hypothetical protein